MHLSENSNTNWEKKQLNRACGVEKSVQFSIRHGRASRVPFKTDESDGDRYCAALRITRFKQRGSRSWAPALWLCFQLPWSCHRATMEQIRLLYRVVMPQCASECIWYLVSSRYRTPLGLQPLRGDEHDSPFFGVSWTLWITLSRRSLLKLVETPLSLSRGMLIFILNPKPVPTPNKHERKCGD